MWRHKDKGMLMEDNREFSELSDQTDSAFALRLSAAASSMVTGANMQIESNM